MFDDLFGGKAWFKSMVGWAALLFLVAETVVPGIAQLGVIDPELAGTLTGWLEKLSALLAGLGIRRRLPSGEEAATEE